MKQKSKIRKRKHTIATPKKRKEKLNSQGIFIPKTTKKLNAKTVQSSPWLGRAGVCALD